jgi:hypothetical protein
MQTGSGAEATWEQLRETRKRKEMPENIAALKRLIEEG